MLKNVHGKSVLSNYLVCGLSPLPPSFQGVFSTCFAFPTGNRERLFNQMTKILVGAFMESIVSKEGSLNYFAVKAKI